MDGEKILIDVNGCVCPAREPYTKMKGMEKGLRLEDGSIVTEEEAKKVKKASTKADKPDATPGK